MVWGNGVGVYINVCMWCVYYTGENHMVFLLSSLTTCKIIPINSRVLLGGDCWWQHRGRGKVVWRVMPCVLFNIIIFLSILLFTAMLFTEQREYVRKW